MVALNRSIYKHRYLNRIGEICCGVVPAEADRTPAEMVRDVKGPKAWGTGLVGALREVTGDLLTVCRHPVYVCTVGGQTLYTGATSPYSPQSMLTIIQCWKATYCIWKDPPLFLINIRYAGRGVMSSSLEQHVHDDIF